MSEPIASFAVIPESESRAFYTVEELKKELESELQFWQWLDGKDAYPKARKRQFHAVQATLERLRLLEKDNDPIALPSILRGDAQLQQQIASLAAHYKSGQALHRSHIHAGWVENLRKNRGESVAGYAVEAGLVPRDGDLAKAEAFAALGLYELGYTPQKPPTQRVWEEMRTQHEALYSEYNNRLHELRERYEQLIPFEAPVKLWSEVRDEMNKSAKLYGIVLMVASVLGAAGLWWLIGHLFGVFGFQAAYDPAQFGNDGIARYWAPAVVVLAVSGVVWVLRIFAKLLFSAIHLRLDARERMAMATTYLSLMENRHVDAERMAIVLTALFRPATTGVIKDPPEFGIWDSIARRLSG